MNYSNQLLTLDSSQTSLSNLEQSPASKLLNKQQRHDLLIKVLHSQSSKITIFDRFKNIFVPKNNWHMNKTSGQRGVTFL